MGLKAFYATQDEVPEALREYYVEKDGKFMLDAEGVEDVTGLKTALGKERTDRRAAEAALKTYQEAVGTDPVKAKEGLTRLAELSNFDPTKEAEKIAETKMRTREAQLIEKHQQALNDVTSKSARVMKQLQKVLVDNAALTAITEAKGAPELLLPIVRDKVRLREDGEQFFVEVLDAQGNPRIGDTQGSPMTIPQLIAELKASPTYGRAFEPSGASGSGAPASGGAGSSAAAGAKKVSIRDQQGLNNNLEGLASGKVVVTE